MVKQRLKRSGFTLIELLVVMAIMMLLMSLVFVGINTSIKHARTVQEMNMVKQIAGAWKVYHGEYGRFPTNMTVTEMSGSVLDIMRGRGPGSTNGLVENPHGLVFMPLRSSTTKLNDRWQSPYQVALDYDYDNDVDVEGYGALHGQVAVWSLGPDRKTGTDDDITSWKKDL
jgi:prepilin-type N-terminal cleavage/methylation domain-containing protein